MAQIMRVVCALNFASEAGEELYPPLTHVFISPPFEAAIKHTFDHALQASIRMHA